MVDYRLPMLLYWYVVCLPAAVLLSLLEACCNLQVDLLLLLLVTSCCLLQLLGGHQASLQNQTAKRQQCFHRSLQLTDCFHKQELIPCQQLIQSSV